MSYKELYFSLFNTISDAIEEIDLQNYGHVKAMLIQAQQDGEERYMEEEDREMPEREIWSNNPSYLALMIRMGEHMRYVLSLIEEGKYKEAGLAAKQVVDRLDAGRSAFDEM